MDDSGDRPRLRYVFDISDTGTREHSRIPWLWKLEDRHMDRVTAMLERTYDVTGDNLVQQLTDVAGKLAEEYWIENRQDFFYIVDGSFLEEYDEFNIGVQFKAAATVSITYALMSRCGLEPEQYFDHEDFMAIFDFNTPATIGALGTAVSQINQQVLRKIGVTVRNAEREAMQERSNHDEQSNELHPERRLSDSRPEVERAVGETAGQVRQDAESISEGTPPDSLQSTVDEREVVSASERDRRDSHETNGTADASAGRKSRSNGEAESQRSDEVDRSDEHLQSSGRGNPDAGTYQQLTLNLFLSENEQIQNIDEAESVAHTSSAFSFAQTDIDHVLRLGDNTDRQRERIVAAFEKQKPLNEMVDTLKSLYHGGNGLGSVSAWYADDGIHISHGRSVRDDKSAQIISWQAAAERIGELLESGQFASNVELAEAENYERTLLAEKLWNLYHDFSEEAREAGYLACLSDIRRNNFPEETRRLTEQLGDSAFHQTLTEEYAAFWTAYSQNRDLLRFHYHRPRAIRESLKDLDLPRRTFTSEMAEVPFVKQFITEDDIDTTMTGGSGFSGGKGRIYTFFQESHTDKEKMDFLKREYGIGGHFHALSGATHSSEDHDGKGLHYKKQDCPDVDSSWEKVSKRITGLIQKGRYLTEQELAEYAKMQEEKAPVEVETEKPIPQENITEAPENLNEPLKAPSQDEIDDDLRTWNGNADSKRAVVRYMADHARERDTGAWLAHEYDGSDGKSLFIFKAANTREIELSWPKVQRRIAQLIQENRFLTEAEQLSVEKNTEEHFAHTSVENINDDLREVLIGMGGLLGDKEKDNLSQRFRNGEDNIQIAEYLSETYTGVADTMELQTGDTVDYFGTTGGLEVNIHDKFGTTLGMSWQEIASVMRTLYEQESEKSTEEILDEHPVSIQVNGEWQTFPNAAAAEQAAYHEYKDQLRRNARNFHITDAHLGEGGPKTKFQANINAIRLLKELESNKQQASPEQQEVLSRYVGWGGLADAFDPGKESWHSEYVQLKELLTPEEYAAARSSTLNAHYTSPTVIRAMYEAVERMGFETGNILEPSMGVGNFFGMLPEKMQNSHLYGVELDPISGWIADDSSYYLLCALEIIDEDGKLERKADMFTKRTIKPHQAVASVDTASEALAVSISEKACVDMAYMSQLTGKSREELAGELQGVIFCVPGQMEQDGTPHYVTADEYLSGNVRRKLRQAQRAAEQNPAFAVNVEALTAAQPKDLDASEIEVRLGATWIDKEYIQQFMYETFHTPYYLQRNIEVNYSSFTAEWQITWKNTVAYNDVAAYTTYGTSRANAYKILEDSLNLRDVRIYDTVEDADGKERRVLNAKETTLAAQKQQAIREAFRDWIWKDQERRQTLVRQYNEEMNSTRPREYDGSHITFGGMNPAITLREHQKNAIVHVLYGGNTLLAHEVGAGKTFEMVAAAMEAKRLGLCQKSLFVVPNHLTEQWASEFLRLYQSANILVTTKKDFETHNRKKFCARIATGDYDAIIIGHVQDRLVALHDLDCPWRPGDLAQRKGRIERQGNSNPLVHVYRYVTEGTFDAYLWQTVENTQKFISQIMTSKSPVRSCDDVDETALNFAEIKALCAGDPRIKERMDLDVEVSRLKLMKADHQSKQYRMEDQLLKYFPEEIEKNKGFIKGFEADLEILVAHQHPEDGFAGMEIRGDLLTDKEKAGAALLDACKEVKRCRLEDIGDSLCQ